MQQRTWCLLLACALSMLLLRHHLSNNAFAPPRVPISRLRTCVRDLNAVEGEAPWLAVYGDSLARSIFFDTVDALNSSTATLPERLHPGHHANYSSDCTIMETRPPLRRAKCGGFAYDWWQAAEDGAKHAALTGGAVQTVRTAPPDLHHLQPPTANDASPQAPRRPMPGQALIPDGVLPARLSFRLKTFSWEAEFDEPWLHTLRHARRLPDVLLLSFGIWDMQYAPNNDVEKGVEAFGAALRRFLAALHAAIEAREGAVKTSGTGGAAARIHPRLYWLSVTAVADDQLPAWKRPRMSVSLARRYNALAVAELRSFNIRYVDTFSSGAAHPELSLDGVHFSAPLARQHADLFWAALCER